MHQFLDIGAHLAHADSGFEVLATTARSQIAVMILKPGEASSTHLNRHSGEDQILYVVEGAVVAELENETRRMTSGQLIVISAGAPHRFVNDGDRSVKTFSVYAPAAY